MSTVRVGTVLELDVGAPAHGGHCVARHEGQVVFVRHALPGERVRAAVTETGRRFLRADAVEVLHRSPDRVVPPCPHAGPGACGGCDWQHADPAAVRRMKTQILTEALRHQGNLATIAGRPLEEVVRVEPVGAAPTGLRWRTRMDYAVGEDGWPGLREHRSARVVAVDDCLIATEQVVDTDVTRRSWPQARSVRVVASGAGDRVVVPSPALDGRSARKLAGSLPADVSLVGAGGRTWVREQAAGRLWRVSAEGFWQVHPEAPDLLVRVVRRMLAPQPGEHLLDLYCGVGLFAGALAMDLGPEGRVDAVELGRRAVADARRNLHDLPQVRLHEASVSDWLRSSAPAAVDLVVLDPTRAGAGAEVMRTVLGLGARAVAYVACDPLALARDLRTAGECGWQVAALEAYDLFPMTHHVESVALLTRNGADPR